MPDRVVREILELVPKIAKRETPSFAEFLERHYTDRWGRMREWHTHVTNEPPREKLKEEHHTHVTTGPTLFVGVAPAGGLALIAKHLRARREHLTERGVRFVLQGEMKDMERGQKFLLWMRPELGGQERGAQDIRGGAYHFPAGVQQALRRAATRWRAKA